MYHKLPTNHKSLVLNRLLIHSTNKNSEVVEKECIIIIKLAKNKFGHFIGPIDYFGLNSRT